MMPAADHPESVETLERLGARLRRRKSGRIHTVDFRPVAPLVGDPELVALEGLHSLVELYLSGTAISDDCLPSLARHGHLGTLDLQQTGIGDRVFELVTQLPELRVLVLSDTAVTVEEVRQQRSRLIQVRLVHLG
ncbi:MAG: hypothetical protein QGH11_01350 [Pirellulaceae bacterium]|nr:hypothetical protein [Pirellulaceae bacterium]